MKGLLSVIVSLACAMVCSKAIAQEGPAELAPQDSSASAMMLRIGKSYLGTAYVANTLDGEEEESLIIQIGRAHV